MQFYTDITIGGARVTLAEEQRDRNTPAWRKANCVYCPVGPSHSEAWLLLTRSALIGLDLNSYLDIVWSTAQSTSFTFKNFKHVISERLFQGAVSDSSLYLCQFADARHFASTNSDSGSVRANIRSYAHDSNYLTGTSGITWADLLETLWTACGGLGAYPGLPVGLPIDSVPETTFLIGLNAYRALCAVLDQLDCGVAHNPFTGTYSIVQLGADQDVEINESRLVWNADPQQGNSHVAATLNVYFNYHYKNYGQEKDTGLSQNWAYNGAGTVVSEATGVDGASGTKAIWEDLPWVLDIDGTYENSADVTARVNSRKDRYVTRYTQDPIHQIYSGILDSYLPGSKIKAVLWRNWGESPNNDFGSAKTEIIGSYNLLGPLGLTKTNCGLELPKYVVSPEYENYSPVDLGRRSYPTYPRLPNFVKIHHTSGSPANGDDVSALTSSLSGYGIHPGKVMRLLNGVMTEYEDCYVMLMNDFDDNLGFVDGVQDEYYYGRLTGMEVTGGVELPCYCAKLGGETPEQVIRFELTATLSLTGHAKAETLNYVGGAWVLSGVEIEVYDWYGPEGMWNGISGYRGFCIRRPDFFTDPDPDRPAYDIIWMERIAQIIQFTSTERMGATTANRMAVTIDWYDHQGKEPQGTIIVRDPQGQFPDVHSGAKGTAEYDNHNGYYRVISSQRVALFASAVLSADLCGATTADITTFAVKLTGDYVGDPPTAPTTVANPQKHAGTSGMVVALRRTNNTMPTPSWEIIDMEKQTVDVVIGIRLNGLDLQLQKLEIYTEYCTDPSAWETWTTATECPEP